MSNLSALPETDPADEAPPLPLAGTRRETMQRLQIGGAGLAAMMLMIALAQVVIDRAKQTDASTVPESAATVAPGPQPAPKTDPLADAGVVPDMPSEPSPTPKQEQAILPEKGQADVDPNR